MPEEPTNALPPAPPTPPEPPTPPAPPAAEKTPFGGPLARRIQRITSRGEKTAKADRPTLYILLGVLGAIFIISLAGIFRTGNGTSTQPTATPLPKDVDYSKIVSGAVRELGDGRIEVAYDFKPDPATGEIPQLRDWSVPETLQDPPRARVGEQVYLIGPMDNQIGFDGDVAVEFVFRILEPSSRFPFSRQATPILCLLPDERDPAVFSGFSLYLSRGGKTALFQLTQGEEQRLTEDQPMPNFPCLEPHLGRFELAQGKLRGYLDGKLVVEAPVPKGARTAGAVSLRGHESEVAFTEIRIVGRPHPDWVRARWRRYRIFSGQGGAP